MFLNRRKFLTRSAASGAAAVVTGVLARGAEALFYVGDVPERSEPMSWPAIRNEFDMLSQDVIHMSSFFLVSHPRPVREAIETHRRAIDSDPFSYVESNVMKMPGVIQASAAEYLGGKPEEVAITNSTTMGLAFVYQGLQLASGDEIVTTTHDHFVHHEAIRLAAERSGSTVKKIALFDDIKNVTEDGIVDRIAKAIGPKTRVVGITWVHSSTGLKLPLRAVAAAIAKINQHRPESERVLTVVDGVHGFGVEDESVAETGVDFFIAGTHKWIFGPRGTGIIWAKADNWRTLRMVFPGFARETVAAWASETKLTAPMRASWIGQGGFHAFEYEWALPAAFEFHKRIGRTRIANRIHELNDQCKEGLASMSRVKLYTPKGNRLSAGMICFEIEGMRAAEVVRRLHSKNVIASTSPYRESYARLAPSLLNTPEQVETTLKRIKEII